MYPESKTGYILQLLFFTFMTKIDVQLMVVIRLHHRESHAGSSEKSTNTQDVFRMHDFVNTFFDGNCISTSNGSPSIHRIDRVSRLHVSLSSYTGFRADWITANVDGLSESRPRGHAR